MSLDLSPLKRRLRKKGGEEDSVWPSLLLTIYSDLSLAKLGPHAAAAIRRYCSIIPAGSLRSALIRDDVGPLTSARITRDIKRMETPAQDDDGMLLIYSSSALGQPGDYGCYFKLWDLEDKGLSGHRELNILRFEFPWTMAEGANVEQAVSAVIGLAQCVPFTAATAGFGFSYWSDDRFAVDQVLSLLPRYLGFEHGDPYTARLMRDRAPTPNWLTFVGEKLIEALGGRDSLPRQLPPEAVIDANGGVVLRASKFPPLGDVNRGAKDIGALPVIAGWLKPLRFKMSEFSGDQVEMDVHAWLSRFDDRAAGPWNNRE